MPNSMLSSGSRGMATSEKDLEVIADNISNSNSIAHKSKTLTATNSFSQTLRNSSSSGNSGSNLPPMQIGTGSQISSIVTDFSKGHKEETGRGTDLYLSGRGFLKVVDSISGASFATRAGNLRIDDRSFVTTQDGLRLQAYLNAQGAMPTYKAGVDNGNIVYNLVSAVDPNAQGDMGDLKLEYDLTVANGRLVNDTGGAFTDEQIAANAPSIKSYSISQEGDVAITMSDDAVVTIGTILLMNFTDEQALTSDGRGLYSNFEPAGLKPFTLSASRPGHNGLGKIEAGAIELSNVDLTKEFTKMIDAQRNFQGNARVISVADSILEEIVNLKR